ncbi:hypothetical protein D3C72_1588580 [compost metagenome]
MDRYRKSTLLDKLHFLVKDSIGALLRATQIQSQVNQTIEWGVCTEPFALDARKVAEPVHLVYGELVNVAVRVTGPQQRVLVRAKFGIRMGRGAGVMRPVVHGSGPAVR